MAGSAEAQRSASRAATPRIGRDEATRLECFVPGPAPLGLTGGWYRGAPSGYGPRPTYSGKEEREEKNQWEVICLSGCLLRQVGWLVVCCYVGDHLEIILATDLFFPTHTTYYQHHLTHHASSIISSSFIIIEQNGWQSELKSTGHGIWEA